MAEVDDGFLEHVVNLKGHDLFPQNQQVFYEEHLSVDVLLFGVIYLSIHLSIYSSI